MNKILEIEYLDSNMIHIQTDEVAQPEIMKTIGYLVQETGEYITLSAEIVGNDWRRQISIPKCAILSKRKI